MFQVFRCNHLHATTGDQVAPLVQLAEICGIAPIVLGGDRDDRPIWASVA